MRISIDCTILSSNIIKVNNCFLPKMLVRYLERINVSPYLLMIDAVNWNVSEVLNIITLYFALRLFLNMVK